MRTAQIIVPQWREALLAPLPHISLHRGLKARVVMRILILMTMMPKMMAIIIAMMLISLTSPILAAAPGGLKAGWRVGVAANL